MFMTYKLHIHMQKNKLYFPQGKNKPYLLSMLIPAICKKKCHLKTQYRVPCYYSEGGKFSLVGSYSTQQAHGKYSVHFSLPHRLTSLPLSLLISTPFPSISPASFGISCIWPLMQVMAARLLIWHISLPGFYKIHCICHICCIMCHMEWINVPLPRLTFYRLHIGFLNLCACNA